MATFRYFFLEEKEALKTNCTSTVCSALQSDSAIRSVKSCDSRTQGPAISNKGSVVEIRNGPTFHDSIESEPSFLIDNTLFSRNGD